MKLISFVILFVLISFCISKITKNKDSRLKKRGDIDEIRESVKKLVNIQPEEDTCGLAKNVDFAFCQAQQDCRSCSSHDNCGWCGKTKMCLPGSKSGTGCMNGPYFCDHKLWVNIPGMCVRLENVSTNNGIVNMSVKNYVKHEKTNMELVQEMQERQSKIINREKAEHAIQNSNQAALQHNIVDEPSFE